jgi:hypothetical protein
MLSVPRASAYLFNTSSSSTNAEIFIRFRSEKLGFLLIDTAFPRQNRVVSAKENACWSADLRFFLLPQANWHATCF